MSLPLWGRMQDRHRQDRDLERTLNLRKNDPYAEQTGRRYTPADIEALEEERVPWLKQRRAEARRRAE
jgi:hypothetical protein